MESKLQLQFLKKEKSIFYQEKMITFTDEIWEELEPLLPEYWHTSVDTLELFEYYVDGSYFCERKKEYYDYRSRSLNQKYYTYVHANGEQAKELFDILCECYEKSRLLYLQSIKEEIKEQLQKSTGIIYENVKYFRIKLLSQSDWSVLPDVVHPEGQLDLWIKYRNYIRTMSSIEDWKENPLEIKIPIDPKQFLNMFPEQDYSDYLEKDEHFENPIASKIREKILRFVQYVCLPSIKESINYSSDSLPEIIKTLQDGLYKIDTSLSIPEIKFTDYDNSYVEEMILNIENSQDVVENG